MLDIDDVVFIMSEAAVQAGVVGTILGIGDEARRRITMRPEVLGQGRETRCEGQSSSCTSSSWGKRPVNMLACEGRVQGAVARASSKRIPRFASRFKAGVVARG